MNFKRLLTLTALSGSLMLSPQLPAQQTPAAAPPAPGTPAPVERRPPARPGMRPGGVGAGMGAQQRGPGGFRRTGSRTSRRAKNVRGPAGFQRGGMSAGRGGPGFAGGAGGGMMGVGMRMGPGGMWWKNPAIVQKLTLTADQTKKMDDIFQASRIQLIDLRANIQKQEALLEPMLSANPPDTAKALAQIDKVAQARADLEKANAKMLLGIRGVLTPDQWTKLHTRGANPPQGAPGAPGQADGAGGPRPGAGQGGGGAGYAWGRGQRSVGGSAGVQMDDTRP
jgi:Spy/CpxP family protein refolding chaperone